MSAPSVPAMHECNDGAPARVPHRARDRRGHRALARSSIADLLLKTLYVQGARTGQQLTDAIRLPFAFVDDQLLSLQQRRLVEVSGQRRGPWRVHLRPDRRRARPRPRGAGLQPVRRPGARAAGAVSHLGRAAVHPERARDARAWSREAFADARAGARVRRHPRSRHQLRQVAVLLRRAGERQDDDRRDDLPPAGRAVLRAVRGGDRRPDHGRVRPGVPPTPCDAGRPGAVPRASRSGCGTCPTTTAATPAWPGRSCSPAAS